MRSTIEGSPNTRLPVVGERASRRGQVAKGAAALLGTLVLVVGVPVALLAAFGTPWPDEMPSIEVLSRPTTSETVLGVLAVVVWLAWAHFVVCLVVEAVAERRNTGLAPRIPGGGIGTQGLARRLVASIVLLAAATSVGMSSASAATAAPHETTSVSQVVSARMAPVEKVAEALPDGTLPAVSALDNATKQDVADGVTTYYDVKPPNGRHYDTLWDMADRYLGDGLRYKEIWDLNKGVTQPDGRVLEKADLIHPGWVMKLPNDAKGPGLKVVDHADEVVAPTEAPAGSAASPEAGTDQAGTDQAGTDQAGAGGASADQAGTATIAQSDDGVQLGGLAPLFGVAGGLVLAGAFLGLRRRRASAPGTDWWATRRTPRPDPLDPDPGPPSPGSRLRDEVDVDTSSWLDRAVRSLSGCAGLPAPLRASVSHSGLAVVFADAPDSDAPAGWSTRGSVWSLDRTVDVEGSGPSTLPGLVSVGRRDDGSVLLLDPEAVRGILALDGDTDVARGTALSIAIDTATHPWADDRVVTLVGFADDVSAIGQGTIRRADDLGRVLESLDNLARYQRSACREAGVATVREARVAAPEAAEWTYHLVLCSGVPSTDELTRLEALAADQQVSLGVVIVGAVRNAEVKLTARADGRLSSPMHGVDVFAQVLTVGAARSLTALYEPPQQSRRVSMDQLVDTLESEQKLAAADDSVASIRVLGPVSVEASGDVDVERVALLTELACFVALHPGGVHANRISAALWPRGVDGEVRDGALRQLGTWLGTTADGQPVVEQDAGIWRFAPGAVDLDWASFRDALNRAAHDGERREVHMRAALDLVSGLAFSDVPAGRYSWLESMTIVGDIAMAVSLTVQACAEAAAGRDDVNAARAVLVKGLVMLPANEELWRSRLRLAAHFGDRRDVEDAVGQMYASISEHGSVLGSSAETDVLVDELVPGYRSRVA